MLYSYSSSVCTRCHKLTIQLAFNVPLENWLLLANRLVGSSLKSMRGSSILRRPQRTVTSLSRSRRNRERHHLPCQWRTGGRPCFWRPVAAHGSSLCSERALPSNLEVEASPQALSSKREPTHLDSGRCASLQYFLHFRLKVWDGRAKIGMGRGMESLRRNIVTWSRDTNIL